MIKKKICMIGAFAVGKTSLVKRFVTSVFTEKYLTTVGVKIDKKTISVNGSEVDLVLWDIHGEDEFQKVRTSYLRGASGYFLVVDGTRQSTLETALMLNKRAVDAIGDVPFICLINKADLSSEWEFEASDLSSGSGKEWVVMNTSAKNGEGVEEAFMTLAEKIMEVNYQLAR